MLAKLCFMEIPEFYSSRFVSVCPCFRELIDRAQASSMVLRAEDILVRSGINAISSQFGYSQVST